MRGGVTALHGQPSDVEINTFVFAFLTLLSFFVCGCCFFFPPSPQPPPPPPFALYE